eukprot:1185862-Prorocentrum_minimum.AAC.2
MAPPPPRVKASTVGDEEAASAAPPTPGKDAYTRAPLDFYQLGFGDPQCNQPPSDPLLVGF